MKSVGDTGEMEIWTECPGACKMGVYGRVGYLEFSV